MSYYRAIESQDTSCSRARFRHVGLACRARLRVEAAGLHIVLAAVRGNWLCMSLRGVRLQRRAGLARSIWSVRVHALHARGHAAGMSVEKLTVRLLNSRSPIMGRGDQVAKAFKFLTAHGYLISPRPSPSASRSRRDSRSSRDSLVALALFMQ